MGKRGLVIMVLFLSRAAWACDTGFAAFEKTVFTKVRRDCVSCHDGRRSDAPAFAVADSFRSYDMLSSYMNFSKIEDSLLVIRAGNSHCGDENCDATSGKEMLEMTKQWWGSGEKSCERNGKVFTAALPLPELPAPPEKGVSETGFVTMRFDLATILAELKGVSFQIDIQDYMAQMGSVKGAYRVRAPRLVGGKGVVYLKDVKVLLNGKYDPVYNAYTQLEREVEFVSYSDAQTATPVLSSQAMIILKDGLAQPKLSISFVGLEVRRNTASCATAKFSQMVVPQLQKQQCAQCHQPAGKTIGEQIFDVTKKDEQVCKSAVQLTDSRFPRISALIEYPVQGLFGHPQVAETERADFSNAIKAWIAK